MKIRYNFVSNSSSSSFIIAIPRDVRTIWKLKELLFQDDEYYYDPYDDLKWRVEDIAAVVSRDLRNPVRDESVLVDEYTSGWTDEYEQAKRKVCSEHGVRDTWEIDTAEKRRDVYIEIDNELRKLAWNKINNFMEKNRESDFYIVEYSDNDGDLFSALEHGTLFDRIPHLKINKH